jgi:hypothetical protein
LKIPGFDILKTNPPGLDIDPAILASSCDMTSAGIFGQTFHMKDPVSKSQLLSQSFVQHQTFLLPYDLGDFWIHNDEESTEGLRLNGISFENPDKIREVPSKGGNLLQYPFILNSHSAAARLSLGFAFDGQSHLFISKTFKI